MNILFYIQIFLSKKIQNLMKFSYSLCLAKQCLLQTCVNNIEKVSVNYVLLFKNGVQFMIQYFWCGITNKLLIKIQTFTTTLHNDNNKCVYFVYRHEGGVGIKAQTKTLQSCALFSTYLTL